jgi:hypothetical protein
MHLAPGRIAARKIDVALPAVIPVAGREADQRTKRYKFDDNTAQLRTLC